MPASEEDGANLFNLPSDVIRKVIGVGQESTRQMVLISHRWNELALEAMNKQARLPKIEWFCLKVNHRGRTTLSMRIPDKFIDYFGVESWNILANSSVSTSDEIEVISEPFIDLFLPNEVYVKKVPENRLRCFTRFFRRCSLVKRLEFDININFRREEIYVLRSALVGVPVKEVQFSKVGIFNDVIAAVVQRFIEYIPVQRLSLGAESLPSLKDLFDACKSPFFEKALTLVPTIELSMVYSDLSVEENLSRMYRGLVRTMLASNPDYKINHILERRVDDTKRFRCIVRRD